MEEMQWCRNGLSEQVFSCHKKEKYRYREYAINHKNQIPFRIFNDRYLFHLKRQTIGLLEHGIFMKLKLFKLNRGVEINIFPLNFLQTYL